MNTVALLKTATGEVISVYARLEDAQATASRYNADPDEDAPYTAEPWIVQERPTAATASERCREHGAGRSCAWCEEAAS